MRDLKVRGESLCPIIGERVSLLSHRTLLALGCHVGMGDEKAEENLKKIKLPKTYENKRYFLLFRHNFIH